MQDKRTTWKREGMATTPRERERERRSAQRGRERVCSVSSDLFAGVHSSCRRFARATPVCTLALEGTTLRHFCVYFPRDFVYRSVCARFPCWIQNYAGSSRVALRQCTEECVSRILFNSDNTFWLRAVPFIFLCDLCTCVIHFWYSVFSCNDSSTMKLEYPCRVEGWLNVCGEYDFFIYFSHYFKRNLSYTRYFVRYFLVNNRAKKDKIKRNEEGGYVRLCVQKCLVQWTFQMHVRSAPRERYFAHFASRHSAGSTRFVA